MFGIGSQELMIILLIAFLVFGSKRLPELGNSLGQAIRGFKKAMEGEPKKLESHETQDQESTTRK
ncbi:MAG TPA: twin-arginine translocase TatA/TatE family subunit [Thermodesulfobacteriota bacterium]|nr:twin-arginine translocase TatA/TatE family subunit [Thermodesulfobacteriota bacterium]